MCSCPQWELIDVANNVKLWMCGFSHNVFFRYSFGFGYKDNVLRQWIRVRHVLLI